MGIHLTYYHHVRLATTRNSSQGLFLFFPSLRCCFLLWSECATHVVLHRVSIRTLEELVEGSVRFGVQWENRCRYFWTTSDLLTNRELAGLVNTWVFVEIIRNGWMAFWNRRPPRSQARLPFLGRPANWQSLCGSV